MRTLVPCLLLVALAGRLQADDSRLPDDAFAILKRACLECHGPKKQEADLRLDSRDAALKIESVLTPGRPDASELLRRVALARNDDERMPPLGEPLSKSEIDTLRRWLESGAAWPSLASTDKHWAYTPPERPPVPSALKSNWGRSPIDAFVLARLEREGLTPSPEANRETLIRRVSLDLVGLPPTPAEVEAFVKDQSADAWERLVDRLLESPQFGVKWARPWLDYARYADSHGFQRDDFRELWAYRDWVVDALNADMPFEQFTVEQLAGDLLPSPTQSQLIATGFNRCAPTNVEAGTEPEETRVNQVFDRVNTVGMVWLGSTMECCQCHDHKYDPFSMRDYYGLFAFFNNTEIEAERTNPKVPGSIQFKGTSLSLEDEKTTAARREFEQQIAALDDQLAVRRKELETPDAGWEAGQKKRLTEAPAIHALEIVSFQSTEGSTSEILPDGSVLLSGETPDQDTYIVQARTNVKDIRAIRLDALTDPSLPGAGPGRGDEKRPNFVLTRFHCEAGPASGAGSKPVGFSSASADFSQKSFSPEQAIGKVEGKGWAINPQFRKPHWATFNTAKPLGHEGGTLLTIRLEQNFGGGRTIGRLKLSVVTGSASEEPIPGAVAEALAVAVDQRTEKQRVALADYRATNDAAAKQLQRQKTKLTADLQKLAVPTTQVMKELTAPRTTAMFQRGNYLSPGEKVEPAIPRPLVSATGSTDEAPRSRLDLARWLASPRNPLAARVTVNRWWGELFGQGLVTTPEDFGLKGEAPTHPELLDWLAVEFHDNGGSIKHLLKTIVLSATYRQSSAIRPELHEQDDRNRLLARGARFRLDAETIRDNALAVAGLLSLKQGGPPIKPYQPDGLWVKVGGQRYDYEVSPGEDRFRRGLYVVCKRGSPYPSFVNFDANNRMSCRVNRPRSNTPTQALTLLNDPVYVEAAKAFARDVLQENEATLDGRLTFAFRRATSRTPTSTELAVLRSLYESQTSDAKAQAAEIDRLIGDFPLPKSIDRVEFAGWYAVCAALLNLDETITKG
ncbi:Planctomycete cytochrome C [Caulifigura coniformis]|uniref:Planctomycete cytochrome C n=1 Tax=Caulifigura coniformis TaxID=2527983 RepID=A0A517S8S5_9PLAN|nr:PSD1 and planctomycete cytochrome C domain-containing protein [Caulifigura coniformis]QDT52506.1 Planctomycete cytochrome C [Caulifigura coniformis]